MVRAFLQPASPPPPPAAAAGSRAWLPPQQPREGALTSGRQRPKVGRQSPFLQASAVLAAEPTAAAAAASFSSGEEEEKEGAAAAAALPAGAAFMAEGDDSDKAALFLALESHPRRKEAFEMLWNSDMEFTEGEYHELLKACFRLGYGACVSCAPACRAVLDWTGLD